MVWSNSGYRGDGGWYKNASSAAFSLTPESSAGTATTTGPLAYGPLSWGNNTRLLVGITWGSKAASEEPSGLSMAGITFTKIAGSVAGPLTNAASNSEWWISSAPVSANSSQTLTVTYSGSGNADYVTAVAVYSLTTTTPTPNAAQAGNSGFSLSVSTSSPLNIPTGGGGVVGFIESFGGQTVTPTNWAFDAGLTVLIGGKTFNWGRTNYTNASNTVSASWPTNNSQSPISTVSWAP